MADRRRRHDPSSFQPLVFNTSWKATIEKESNRVERTLYTTFSPVAVSECGAPIIITLIEIDPCPAQTTTNFKFFINGSLCWVGVHSSALNVDVVVAVNRVSDPELQEH